MTSNLCFNCFYATFHEDKTTCSHPYWEKPKDITNLDEEYECRLYSKDERYDSDTLNMYKPEI